MATTWPKQWVGNPNIWRIQPEGIMIANLKITTGQTRFWNWNESLKKSVLVVVSNWKNGILDGRAMFFHPDGKTKKIETYRNGVVQGFCREYHSDGSLKAEVNLLNGRKEGLCRWRYKVDSPLVQGTFKNNVAVGWWTDYHPNGKVQRIRCLEYPGDEVVAKGPSGTSNWTNPPNRPGDFGSFVGPIATFRSDGNLDSVRFWIRTDEGKLNSLWPASKYLAWCKEHPEAQLPKTIPGYPDLMKDP